MRRAVGQLALCRLDRTGELPALRDTNHPVVAGDPDLINKIADEKVCTEVPALVAYLEEHAHPALTMDPMM